MWPIPVTRISKANDLLMIINLAIRLPQFELVSDVFNEAFQIYQFYSRLLAFHFPFKR